MIGLGKAIAPGLDPKLVAGELRERVLEELDFELEAQQQRTFARAYRGHPFVYVPEVITALSRRRVLVTEWVSGRRFEEILALEQAERDRVGEIVVRFFFGSMARVGRFNTDPHPGNYMLLDDGRMAFLDFGNTVVGDREVMRWAVDGAPSRATLTGSSARPTISATCATSSATRPGGAAAQALQVGDWYLRTSSCGSIRTTSRA